MKGKSFLISTVILSAAVVVLGLCIRSGLNGFSRQDRVVEVRGLCEREVAANKVTWPIVFQEVSNSLPELYTRMENSTNKVLDFLHSNGISDSEISRGVPDVYDQMAQRYGSGQDARYRYQAQNTIVVTSSQVDQVRGLIERQMDLIREGVSVRGADYNNQVTYEFTGLNEIKPEMIADATASARQAADRFGEDSGSHVGKIKNATQGQFSISDRDQYTPYIKNIRVVTYITYYLED